MNEHTLVVRQKPDTPIPKLTTIRSGALQRKCACGGTSGPDGQCVECRQKRLTLQRRSDKQTEPSTAPPIVNEVLRSPGQLLDLTTRTFMEPRFGQDFSQVQVHSKGKPAESALTDDTLVYALGGNLAFGIGQHAPNESRRQELLAYEVTYVVRQSVMHWVRKPFGLVPRPATFANNRSRTSLRPEASWGEPE